MSKERPETSGASEEWHPVPFADRKSQNLTFGDFFNRALSHLLIGGFSGSAVGWCIDVVRAKKTNHLNDGFGSFKWWGGLIGGLMGGFVIWRRNEAMQLQTDQVLREYRNLPGLIASNDELAAENQLLKRMVAYQRTKLTDMPDYTIVDRGREHLGSLHAGSPQQHLS